MPDVPEDYYYSSLEAEEIEDRLLHVVTYHKTMHLSDEEKALFRTNIGAGTANTGLIILGYFDTLEDLRESLTVLPKAGDAYGIGTSAPYDIYIYDGYHGVWINNGPLNPGGTTFDDNTVSATKGWTSNKIKSELITLDGNKQAKITASGILKGNGSGGVSAAVAGTDYLTPATNYSPLVRTAGGTVRVLTSADVGKTFWEQWTSTIQNEYITYELTEENSVNMPLGTEIAFLTLFSKEVRIKFTNIRAFHSELGFFNIGNGHTITVKAAPYNLVAMKKIDKTYGTNTDCWLLTGNVEVVS